MNSYEIKNTCKALRDLRVAYYKLIYCWDNDNTILDSDVSLKFFPFKISFDEIGLDSWIEEILDEYDESWDVSEDSKRIDEDNNLNLEDRTIKALKEFKKAWFDVYSVWGENDMLDSQIARNEYPFDNNWDEIYVRDWVDKIVEKF